MLQCCVTSGSTGTISSVSFGIKRTEADFKALMSMQCVSAMFNENTAILGVLMLIVKFRVGQPLYNSIRCNHHTQSLYARKCPITCSAVQLHGLA